MIKHVTHDAQGNTLERTITKIKPRWNGHLHLTFDDGSHQLVFRGAHEKHALQVGDKVKVHHESEVEVTARADKTA